MLSVAINLEYYADGKALVDAVGVDGVDECISTVGSYDLVGAVDGKQLVVAFYFVGCIPLP